MKKWLLSGFRVKPLNLGPQDQELGSTDWTGIVATPNLPLDLSIINLHSSIVIQLGEAHSKGILFYFFLIGYCHETEA